MPSLPSAIDIISAGKWERALFTTYALSLTFFETHILKDALLKTGCQAIWVVADLDGYQRSLTERQSARVGQEYHLVPVALPHGVFTTTMLPGRENSGGASSASRRRLIQSDMISRQIGRAA